MKTTHNQCKTSNAIIYIRSNIQSIDNVDILFYLRLINLLALNDSGVPITWTNDYLDSLAVCCSNSFNDNQFSDYEIDIMDKVIYHMKTDSIYLLFELIEEPHPGSFDEEIKDAALEVAVLSNFI